MRKVILLLLILLTFVVTSLYAQDTYFGKNKVRYKNFDWSFIQTRHFDIYFYEDAYKTAKFSATVLESSYVEVSKELNYKIQRRIPVFVYNSHNDFQQTNIIGSLIGEGTGGFTEVFKSRIVIPFTGSYENLRHVLHHELTHAVTYDMLYGNVFSSLLSRQRLFAMPLWLAEGFAEYSSRHGWDYYSDMFVRDATINGYLTPPQYLGGYLAYRQGQAMIKYIADKYGEDKLGKIFRKGKVYLTMNKALKESIGITEEEFWKEFSKEMKRRYWPEIANRKEADEISRQLTHAREDGSYYNEKPVFTSNGDKLAIFTDESDYTEIVLISAHDGERLDRLVKSQRSGDLESLHSYVSGVSFSPDGLKMVFVAKSEGKEALFLYDMKERKTYQKKKFDYYNLITPTWSPDGKKIAFSALEGHKRDIFIYYLEEDSVVQVTNDRFDDLSPSWLSNSEGLVFSSDRTDPQIESSENDNILYSEPASLHPGDFDYGKYNIFKVDLNSSEISYIDVGPGENKSPRVAPSGDKIAFVSNRNGIDNIYIGYLDSTKYYALTDILTGISSISWAPDGNSIAMSAFFQGAFDIFILDNLMPVGEDGVLQLTDYYLGKYNLLKKDSSDKIIAKHRNKENNIKSVNDSTLLDTTNMSDNYAVVDSLTDSGKITADDSEENGEKEKDEDIVTETGIYDDEFVYVEEKEKTPLDSLMTDVMIVERDDGVYTPLDEPASFDSIPPLLESGEFEINEYKVKFTPDYVGGGFSYDTFFGLRGNSYFVFSDYLGNHQIYIATDLVNTIDQSNIQIFYSNNKNRTRFGFGVFHTKNFYIETVNNIDHLFSDRFYGLQFFASRPYSIFSRLDFSVTQSFIDREYYDFDDPREDTNSKIAIGNLSYVTDNIIWGITGPVNGRRAKLSLSEGIDLFDSQDTVDVQYTSIEFDYRKYWHFDKTYSMALRISGGASLGKTPKLYFLGGTTNWIGDRTLDAQVYEVENLYFADVITPLRGLDNYGINGTRYGLINWEFRFPMIDYFAMRFPLPLVISRVQGTIFTDIGAAWFYDDFKGGSSEGGNHLQDIKTGFGFGMRANLGFLLLRYDLAWSTDFDYVSDKPSYYFSLGADF